jgi:hypothetical protein
LGHGIELDSDVEIVPWSDQKPEDWPGMRERKTPALFTKWRYRGVLDITVPCIRADGFHCRFDGWDDGLNDRLETINGDDEVVVFVAGLYTSREGSPDAATDGYIHIDNDSLLSEVCDAILGQPLYGGKDKSKNEILKFAQLKRIVRKPKDGKQTSFDKYLRFEYGENLVVTVVLYTAGETGEWFALALMREEVSDAACPVVESYRLV